MAKIDSHHAGMSPQDRAKQFMPFAALKGYEEALRAKEKEIEALNEQKNKNIKYVEDTEHSEG